MTMSSGPSSLLSESSDRELRNGSSGGFVGFDDFGVLRPAWSVGRMLEIVRGPSGILGREVGAPIVG